jgi:hypothetical protein
MGITHFIGFRRMMQVHKYFEQSKYPILEPATHCASVCYDYSVKYLP